MTDVFRYELSNGDMYIGEVISRVGDVVNMGNYSAWFEGASEPFNPHFEDTVRFRTDKHTRVVKL